MAEEHCNYGGIWSIGIFQGTTNGNCAAGQGCSSAGKGGYITSLYRTPSHHVYAKSRHVSRRELCSCDDFWLWRDFVSLKWSVYRHVATQSRRTKKKKRYTVVRESVYICLHLSCKTKTFSDFLIPMLMPQWRGRSSFITTSLTVGKCGKVSPRRWKVFWIMCPVDAKAVQNVPAGAPN